MEKDIDSISRDKIIFDLDHNFFVNASAGSGKTFSLVNRMVALIESGKATADQICTITFTKAAANEFYERFQNLLSIHSVKEKELIKEEDRNPGILGNTTETTRKLCEKALNDIDLCFMGTIDSFCDMIAHEFPNEFDLPAKCKVVDEDKLKARIAKKYIEACSNLSHPLANTIFKFRKAFNKNDLDAFINSYLSINEFRDSEIKLDKKYINFDFDKEFLIEKQLISDLYNSYILDKDLFSNKANTKEIFSSLKSIVNVSFNDNIYILEKRLSDLIKFDGTLPKTLAGGALESKNFIEEKRNAKTNKVTSYLFSETFLTSLKNVYQTILEYKYDLTFEIVSYINKELTSELKNEGALTYYDFIYYLRNAFKKSSSGDHKLIDHITKKHKYFLIDESQDTNPIQTEMFFYLNSTVKTDCWQDCKPKDGSLFIVGDPKQSIYRFRHADVSAYLNVEKVFKDKGIGEVLLLTRNYRSNTDIKQYFNDVMNKVLQDGLTVEKLDHRDIPLDIDKEDLLIESNATFKGLYRYCACKKKNGDSETDADFLVKLVKEIVKNDKYTIAIKDKKTKKKIIKHIDYKDIMIVPPTTTMGKYIKSFKDANIPLKVEGLTPFNECESFNIVKNLIYLLRCPNDVSYLFKVLSSPLFNLNENNFNDYINKGINLDISHEIDLENDDVNIKYLKELYAKTKYFSYSSLFSYLTDKEKYPSNIHLLEVSNLDFLECLYYAIELVKDAEINGEITSFESFKSFIENVYKDKDYSRCLRFNEKEDKVTLANVHKVKGLEAPIIILNNVITQDHKPQFTTKVIDDKSYAYVFGVEKKHDGGISESLVQTNRFPIEIEEEENYQEAEKRRLEYVGATRAISTLIISSFSEDISDSYSNNWKHLIEYSNPKILQDLPSLEKNDEEHNIEQICKRSEYFKKSSISFDVSLKEPSNKTINPSKIGKEIESPYISKVSGGDTIKEAEPSLYDPKIFGTLFHAFMEKYVSSEFSLNVNDLISYLLSSLSNPEFYQKQLETAVNKMLNGGFKQVNGKLSEDFIKELKSAEEIHCEVPFCLKEGNEVIYGTMDLIYLKDDVWKIVDYKTDLEKDINVLNETYKHELNCYKKALKEIMGIEAETFIYHIDK